MNDIIPTAAELRSNSRDRIADLERELAAAKARVADLETHCRLCDDANTYPKMVADLRAELAALRQDKERLDWLEVNGASLLFWVKPDPNGDDTIPAWLVENALLNNERPLAREAIDAARKA